MVRVIRIEPGSAAERAGLVPGDRIAGINGQVVEDYIDFHYLAADAFLELELARPPGAPARTVRLERTPGQPLGIEIDQGRIGRCRNRCVFCFVDQLPRGLRRPLYLKDEDYRQSFLSGNFITGTALRPRDLERIIAMGLGPLYLSVHATEPELRRRMLGLHRRGEAEVLPLLERLAAGGVGMHFQVVLCPGLNDGPALERTILELEALGGEALSLAVVPVGLTAHRTGLTELRPVVPDLARAVLRQIHRHQRSFLKRRGSRFVFAADELYLLAGRRLPGARAYEGYPQLENGIGLVRRSLERLAQLRRSRRGLPARGGRSYRLVTGALYGKLLAGPLLPRLEELLPGRVGVTVVENSLLGRSITVAGLLPGRDILRALAAEARAEVYLIPEAALNHEDRFIDDLQLEELRRSLAPSEVVVAPDLARAIRLIAGREAAGV